MQLTQTWGVTLISRGIILGLSASSHGALPSGKLRFRVGQDGHAQLPVPPDAYADPSLYYPFLILDPFKEYLGFRA